MTKEEREKLAKQKQIVRGEIAELQQRIANVQRVPDRVVNGDYVTAVKFKDSCEKAKRKVSCAYKGGTLADLVAIKNRLQDLASAIQ